MITPVKPDKYHIICILHDVILSIS